jgi:redox-sensitive bicupin YhaK (pirin superfamily)
VGAHPHKGFETVTLVYEGQLAHRDSAGGGGEIGAGDIQWMTAGSGLLHEEFQAESFRIAGGTQHMAQICVNLPARNKNAPPTYQSITSEKINDYVLDGQEGKVRVIAGNFKGIGGAARTFTPVEMYDVRLKEGAKLEFDLPASYNSMLLVTQGEWLVNGRDISFKDFVLFGHQGSAVQLTAKTDGSVLVLSGEPINEPVASYGPFVMNTQDEIVQAIKDYRTGKFGTL